jgi:hypothetical protein
MIDHPKAWHFWQLMNKMTKIFQVLGLSEISGNSRGNFSGSRLPGIPILRDVMQCMHAACNLKSDEIRAYHHFAS